MTAAKRHSDTVLRSRIKTLITSVAGKKIEREKIEEAPLSFFGKEIRARNMSDPKTLTEFVKSATEP